jgi:hypothetical protein
MCGATYAAATGVVKEWRAEAALPTQGQDQCTNMKSNPEPEALG